MTIPSSACYSLSGLLSPYDAYTYIPCNLTAVENGDHSACCAPGDKCLTNGLCQYGGPMNGANEFWRVACTDKTWRDPACHRYCENIEPGLEPSHLVFQCPGQGKWCCGTGHITDYPERGTLNTTCCDMDDLKFDAEAAVVYTTARAASISLSVETSSAQPTGTFASSVVGFPSSLTSVASAQTGAGSAEETALASATPSTKPSGSSSNSLALGLGFGLGIPLASIIIIGVLFLFLRRRKQTKDSVHAHYGPESQEDLRQTHPHAFYREAGGREMAVELDAKKEPVEVWSPTSPKLGDKDMYR